MLLEPDVWQGLDMSDYEQWATQVWHILMLRASRRYVIFDAIYVVRFTHLALRSGQTRMISDYLWPKRFIHGASLKEYTFGPGTSLNSMIRDPLHEVLTMRVSAGDTVIVNS